MSKTTSYEKHSTHQAVKNLGNEVQLTVNEQSFKLPKSTIFGSIAESSSQLNDLAQQPTASGSNFEFQYTDMFPDIYNLPRFSYSIKDSTSNEYLSNQTDLLTKPKVQAQSNYAREVPSEVKSAKPIPLSTIIRDAYKVLYSPETFNFNEDSNTENLTVSKELNGANDQKSLYDSLHVTESLERLISLYEPPPITFQEENNEGWQNKEETTTMVEDTSEQVTQLHELQPVKFSYDVTNTTNGLTQTSTLHQPNFSFPAKAQSDKWNGFIVPATATTMASKHSYSKPNQNHVDKFAMPQIQYKATVPFKHQIYIQKVPLSVKPTTVVNSSVKVQGKAERSKNIVIHSNELAVSPMVRSFIRTQKNDIVLIKPNQIHLLSKSGQKSEPIRMAPKSIFKCPTKVVTNPTRGTTITLKRKNKENILPVTPSKVQKADSCSTSSVPDIFTELFGEVGDVEQRPSSENKSFSDCLKYLERNNVTVLKVPQ